MKIICFPHAGGNASSYTAIEKYFTGKIEFITYEYDGHGRKRNQEQYKDFKSAVRKIVDDMVSEILDGHESYCLLGHSMGAYIALEVSYQLQQIYDYPPKLIYISGQSSPINIKNKYVEADNDRFMEYIVSLGGIDSRIAQDTESLTYLLEPTRNDLRLLTTYHPSIKNVKLKSDLYVMYGKQDVEIDVSELKLWKDVTCGNIEIKEFEGGHFYITEGMQVAYYIENVLKEKGVYNE